MTLGKLHLFRVEQLGNKIPVGTFTWIRIVVTDLRLPLGNNMIENSQRIQSCLMYIDKEAKTQICLDSAVMWEKLQCTDLKSFILPLAVSNVSG